MFSPDMKKMISEKVQKILQETHHHELPKGEINFLLHVDGKEDWSWANIQNNGDSVRKVPKELIMNTSRGK